MSDSFTDTTTTSWFTRIKNALIGIVIGIVLIVGSIVGIFWNEHRAVQTSRSLAQGRGLVVDVDAQTPDASKDGKLVHVAGQASATRPLEDPQFAVSATGLRLTRVAEMYQWKEKKSTETHKNLGGSETQTTTYSYEKVWSEDAIDSSRFQHPQDHGNPGKAVSGRAIYAQDAKLGGFSLDQTLLGQLPSGERFSVPQDISGAVTAKNPGAQISDGAIYIGQNPSQPSIGDTRISYQLTPAGPLSVIAAQAGTGFSPFKTEAGDELAMLRPGILSAQQMFAAAEEENALLTWAIRAALMLAIWIGFYLCLRPVAVFADLIPFVGSLVGFGLGSAAFLATLIVGPAAIAIAWFAYRPIVGAAVLVAGVALAIGWHFLRSRRKPAPTPAATRPAT